MLDFQKLCRWYNAYCGVVRTLELALLGSMVVIGLPCEIQGVVLTGCGGGPLERDMIY